MEIYLWVTRHWAEIGVVYLVVLKFLTAIQDAVDSQPAGLKPPFGKLLYYMSALSQYLFLGNRPTSIGALNVKTTNAVNNAIADSGSK